MVASEKLKQFLKCPQNSQTKTGGVFSFISTLSDTQNKMMNFLLYFYYYFAIIKPKKKRFYAFFTNCVWNNAWTAQTNFFNTQNYKHDSLVFFSLTEYNTFANKINILHQIGNNKKNSNLFLSDINTNKVGGMRHKSTF